MARTYSRDGRGKFASPGRKGDVAKTVQQASREKKREQRDAKDKLSGSKLGAKRGARLTRSKSAGKGASLKSVAAALDRAKARFK